jgi:hypothetical protein
VKNALLRKLRSDKPLKLKHRKRRPNNGSKSKSN